MGKGGALGREDVEQSVSWRSGGGEGASCSIGAAALCAPSSTSKYVKRRRSARSGAAAAAAHRCPLAVAFPQQLWIQRVHINTQKHRP